MPAKSESRKSAGPGLRRRPDIANLKEHVPVKHEPSDPQTPQGIRDVQQEIDSFLVDLTLNGFVPPAEASPNEDQTMQLEQPEQLQRSTAAEIGLVDSCLLRLEDRPPKVNISTKPSTIELRDSSSAPKVNLATKSSSLEPRAAPIQARRERPSDAWKKLGPSAYNFL